MERVGGIEPPATAWKAVVLPLYDTRVYFVSAGRPATRRLLFNLYYSWSSKGRGDQYYSGCNNASNC